MEEEVEILSNSTVPSRYIALSYEWGDASITNPIVVDDIEVQVTTNLESALRELRRSMQSISDSLEPGNEESERRKIDGIDTSSLFWIDALSIN
jgi:uncharacterized protein involved in exopolysaccharide biosynthesis